MAEDTPDIKNWRRRCEIFCRAMAISAESLKWNELGGSPDKKLLSVKICFALFGVNVCWNAERIDDLYTDEQLNKAIPIRSALLRIYERSSAKRFRFRVHFIICYEEEFDREFIVPLFEVDAVPGSIKSHVDAQGEVYESVQDWKARNNLPKVLFFYEKYTGDCEYRRVNRYEVPPCTSYLFPPLDSGICQSVSYHPLNCLEDVHSWLVHDNRPCYIQKIRLSSLVNWFLLSGSPGSYSIIYIIENNIRSPLIALSLLNLIAKYDKDELTAQDVRQAAAAIFFHTNILIQPDVLIGIIELVKTCPDYRPLQSFRPNVAYKHFNAKRKIIPYLTQFKESSFGKSCKLKMIKRIKSVEDFYGDQEDQISVSSKYMSSWNLLL